MFLKKMSDNLLVLIIITCAISFIRFITTVSLTVASPQLVNTSP